MKQASEIVDHARKHFEVYTWSVEKSKLEINGERGKFNIMVGAVLRNNPERVAEITKKLIEETFK